MADVNVQRCPIPCPSYPLTDIYRFLQPGFRKFAEKHAMIDSDSGKTLTFRELEDDIERVASCLALHGVGRDDTVVVYAQNSTEVVIVMFATWRLGGIYCPINKLLTSYEVRQLVDIVQPSYIFTDRTCVENMLQVMKQTNHKIKVVFVREEHPECVSFASLINPAIDHQREPRSNNNTHGVEFIQQRAPLPDDINTDDVACILFSSGTTGLPKAVQLTHRNCIFSLSDRLEPPFSTQSDYQVVYMPMSHIYGMMMMCRAVVKGNTSIIMKQFQLEEYLRSVSKYKVRALHLVPPLAVVIAKHRLVGQYDLTCVEEILCGAAPIGEKTIAELRQRFRKHIHFRQAYGMTETCGAVTMTPDRDSANHISSRSVGVPVPGVEVKVVDMESGENLGAFKQGEICSRGTNSMKGYVRNPVADAEIRDEDGWIHTGDIGYYDNNGAFFVVDRLKELIKYKGYQVAPAELEDTILSHPLVTDAAVIGIADREAGEVPLALVVKQHTSSLSEKQVVDFVSERVAVYKRLRGGVRFVDAIPKSPSGKILRKEITKTINKLRGKL